MPKKTVRPGDDERRRAIGQRIRALRTAAGIGQRQMARALGMSSSWLNSVEAGELGIDAVRLADIAAHLGQPAGAFFEDYGEDLPPARQVLSRPVTTLEWQLMFAGDRERARAHYELDLVFRRVR